MGADARQKPLVAPGARTQGHQQGKTGRREAVWGLIFISPWLIGFLVFQVGPMLASLYLSFTQYDSLTAPRWIGLENYRYMFTGDELFLTSLWVTISYTLFVVPLGVGGSLLSALLLSQPIRGRALFRALFFIPSITPAVASIFVWTWLLNPHYGLINYLLGLIGIAGPYWLGDPAWARTSLVLLSLWAAVGGTTMITFIAALQNIPQHLYEAAEIDGAGAFKRFVHVTFPMLTPTIFFNVILGIIGSFQQFTIAYVATNGGPLYSTYFYVLHLYLKAFRFFEMGYASALAWILFFILLMFTFLQFRYSSRWVHYDAEV